VAAAATSATLLVRLEVRRDRAATGRVFERLAQHLDADGGEAAKPARRASAAMGAQKGASHA
jgi:hypothetical protein